MSSAANAIALFPAYLLRAAFAFAVAPTFYASVTKASIVSLVYGSADYTLTIKITKTNKRIFCIFLYVSNIFLIDLINYIFL